MFGELLFASVPFADFGATGYLGTAWADICPATSAWKNQGANADAWSDQSGASTNWKEMPLSKIPSRRCD